MLLENKVALVTGGGQGIGEGIALVYAREGAKVIVVDFNEEAGKDTVEKIKATGSDAAFFKADVTNEEQVKAMVEFAVKTYGKLDCACNCAGRGSGQKNVADLDIDTMNSVMNINLNGVFLCCREEVKAMKENGRGAIVNISSESGIMGSAGLSPYTASKHAVLGLTKCMALEEIKNNININAVCPGTTETKILDNLKKNNPEYFKQICASIPAGRLAQTEDIANVVAFLSSDLSKYMVGATVVVDGGHSIQ